MTCSKSCSTDVCTVCRLAVKYPLMQADTAMNGKLGASSFNAGTVLMSCRKYSPATSAEKYMNAPKIPPDTSEIKMHFLTAYFAFAGSPFASSPASCAVLCGACIALSAAAGRPMPGQHRADRPTTTARTVG